MLQVLILTRSLQGSLQSRLLVQGQGQGALELRLLLAQLGAVLDEAVPLGLHHCLLRLQLFVGSACMLLGPCSYCMYLTAQAAHVQLPRCLQPHKLGRYVVISLS